MRGDRAGGGGDCGWETRWQGRARRAEGTWGQREAICRPELSRDPECACLLIPDLGRGVAQVVWALGPCREFRSDIQATLCRWVLCGSPDTTSCLLHPMVTLENQSCRFSHCYRRAASKWLCQLRALRQDFEGVLPSSACSGATPSPAASAAWPSLSLTHSRGSLGYSSFGDLGAGEPSGPRPGFGIQSPWLVSSLAWQPDQKTRHPCPCCRARGAGLQVGLGPRPVLWLWGSWTGARH